MRKKMISLMMTVAMGTVMISGATVVKADSDEKETVKLAVWSSGAADNFQKGADEFNKRQDKINFVVEMQSGDYSQYLGAKVASNDLPDMFFLNPYAQVQQFAATDRKFMRIQWLWKCWEFIIIRSYLKRPELQKYRKHSHK